MNKLDRIQTTDNERRASEIDSGCNKPTGRRRHLTTFNRVADIPEEEENCQQSNEQANSNQANNRPIEAHCCCHSRLVLCPVTYRLPDLIVQHQPAIIMSADVHFEQSQSINQMPIDNLASKLALVYTPHWIENDVFLPANTSNEACMSNNASQANNQAINRVNNSLNNQANKKKPSNQSNKVDIYSPRIVRCQLANSALYQYNQRSNAKIMLNNVRRSASVSLPIDHETLRQVGHSLRMISEQFHLQRLQANAMAKNQQTCNVSLMIRWFCKLVVNKLPSISWKANSRQENDPISSKSSPAKLRTQRKNNQVNQSDINQLSRGRLNSQSDQPDVVPMVHLIIPVRQRCHSTTTDC